MSYKLKLIITAVMLSAVLYPFLMDIQLSEKSIAVWSLCIMILPFCIYELKNKE